MKNRQDNGTNRGSQIMKAISFGEILWDIIENKAHIGGAPFNLTAHLAKMGMRSYIISALGDDDLGHQAMDKVKSFNMNDSYISVLKKYPTGTVDVELTGDGMPTYIIHEDTAWDNIVLTKEQLNKLSSENWDVFCFGTLAQRTESNRKLLFETLENISAKHIFYDVNLRQEYYRKEWIETSLHKSTIVKVNDEEAVFLSKQLFNKEMPEKDFAEKLSNKYNIELVCITRGGEGVAIYHNNNFIEIPSVKVKVADTVGAGDSFSAGFLYAYLSGKNPQEAANFAVKVGGFVASSFGAIPDYSGNIKKEIDNLNYG